MKLCWMGLCLWAGIAYLGSYFLLLDPQEQPDKEGVYGLNGPTLTRIPAYRLGGKAAERLFAPLQKLDQKVRPWYWSYSVPVCTTDLDIPLTSTKLTVPHLPDYSEPQ